jgi:hypothetical protein
MTVVDVSTCSERFENMFYDKCLQENIEYLEKHGIGPYAMPDGRFKDRVHPYLSAGYWHAFDNWVYDEFKAVNASAFKEFHFQNEQDAIMFVLKYL